MHWTDGWGNTPYDPDMTVGEALDLGLIAVIDTGVIGRTYHEPCHHGGPMKGQSHIICTRAKGHSGTHANVVRWNESWQDIELRERDQKSQQRKEELREQQRLAEIDEANRMRAMVAKNANQTIAKEVKKISDAMQEAATKKEQRAFEGIQRNFRDQTAGKIRGPRR